MASRESNLEVPHTLYTIQTLQLAKQSGFGIDEDGLERARKWILAHVRAVTGFCQEKIILKLNGQYHRYRLTHYTPALFLLVITIDGNTQLQAARCLNALENNLDWEECAFTEKRPASWATAKCVTALRAVEHRFESFPKGPHAATQSGAASEPVVRKEQSFRAKPTKWLPWTIALAAAIAIAALMIRLPQQYYNLLILLAFVVVALLGAGILTYFGKLDSKHFFWCTISLVVVAAVALGLVDADIVSVLKGVAGK